MAECSAKREDLLSLPIYYEGYLHKKFGSDKVYKKQWLVLRGNMLCFQAKKADTMTQARVGRTHGVYYPQKFVETINLKSPLTLITKYMKKTDNSVAKLMVNTETREIKLRAPTIDCMELWRVFLFAVTELKVPEDSCLPLEKLLQVCNSIKAEKERVTGAAFLSRPPMPSPPMPPLPELLPKLPQMKVEDTSPQESSTYTNTNDDSIYAQDLLFPSCFYKVNRVEAEEMLHKNPEWGNLLIRPATNNVDYSVSILHSGPLNRPCQPLHYKVVCKNERYIIELTKRVEVTSLHQVVDHFVKATNAMLTPFIQQPETLLHYDAPDTAIYADLIDGQESTPQPAEEKMPDKKAKPALPRKKFSTRTAQSSLTPSSGNDIRQVALPPRYVGTQTAPSLPPQPSENDDNWRPALPPRYVGTQIAPSLPSQSSENATNWTPESPPKDVTQTVPSLPSLPPKNGIDELKKVLKLRRLQIEDSSD